ncbi:hypothetical protein B0H14DRAFT_2607052 [Mycena olivaceomarginata]|nr:hypothetical protein B0H14DRAFT_2607052 [Mycena olivaceomarginata]
MVNGYPDSRRVETIEDIHGVKYLHIGPNFLPVFQSSQHRVKPELGQCLAVALYDGLKKQPGLRTLEKAFEKVCCEALVDEGEGGECREERERKSEDGVGKNHPEFTLALVVSDEGEGSEDWEGCVRERYRVEEQQDLGAVAVVNYQFGQHQGAEKIKYGREKIHVCVMWNGDAKRSQRGDVQAVTEQETVVFNLDEKPSDWANAPQLEVLQIGRPQRHWERDEAGHFYEIKPRGPQQK